MTTIPPSDWGKKPKKARKCPRCGAESIADIMYGMPDNTPELQEALKKGELSLGGCCVSDDSPRWECNEWGKTWGKTWGRRSWLR
ncbi:MAG: hypothetical protein HN341_11905 [Verrucomicrobia bacterium]|nr:hypothetical protein [Verrucomicrobiota bacterium]